MAKVYIQPVNDDDKFTAQQINDMADDLNEELGSDFFIYPVDGGGIFTGSQVNTLAKAIEEEQE